MDRGKVLTQFQLIISDLNIALSGSFLPFSWCLNYPSQDLPTALYAVSIAISIVIGAAFLTKYGMKASWFVIQGWAALAILSDIVRVIVDLYSTTTETFLPYDMIAIVAILKSGAVFYLQQPQARVYFGIIPSAKTILKTLNKVEQLTARGRLKKALFLCRELIFQLTGGADLPETHRAHLVSAYLAQGRVFEAQGQETLVRESYLAAFSAVQPADLSAQELTTLAVWLGSQKDASDQAKEVYLAYLQRQAGALQLAVSDPVCELLRSMCHIEEGASPEQSNERATFAERVIKANDFLDWAHYYYGLALMAKRDFRNAITHFKRSQVLNPHDKKAPYFAGICQAILEEQRAGFETAIEIIETTVSSSPDMPWGYYHAARMLVVQCEMAESEDEPGVDAEILRLASRAVSRAERAVSLKSDVPDFHYYLGRALSYAGEGRSSLAAYRRAIELNDKVREYHLHLAVELMRLSELQDVEILLTKALDLDAQYADTHKARGDLSLLKGNYDDALAHYREALAYNPEHRPARLGLGKTLYLLDSYPDAISELQLIQGHSREGRFLLARSFLFTGRFEDALPLLESLTARSDVGAEAHYYLGCVHAHLRSFPSAMDAFRSCLNLDASYWRAHLQRGHCQLAAGHVDDAISEYQASRSLRAEDTETILALARCYLLKNELAAAEDFLNVLAEVEPMRYEFNMLLGALAEKQGTPERVETAYLAAAEIKPEEPDPHRRLGVLFSRAGRYQEAIDHLERALGAGCDVDTVLYHLGWARAQLELFDSALNIWQELHRRHPDDEPLKNNLGSLKYLLGFQLQQAGDFAAAAAAWEEFFKFQPEDSQMRRDLAEVCFRAGVTSMAHDADLPAADKSLHRALELNGDHAAAPFYLALGDILNGNAARAAQSLEQFSDGQSPSLQVRSAYHQALALLKMGQTSRAIEILGRIANHPLKSEVECPVDWALAVAYALGSDWENCLSALKITSS